MNIIVHGTKKYFPPQKFLMYNCMKANISEIKCGHIKKYSSCVSIRCKLSAPWGPIRAEPADQWEAGNYWAGCMQNTEAAVRRWQVASTGNFTWKWDLRGLNTGQQRSIHHQGNRTSKYHATWETLQVFWGRGHFHGSTVVFWMALVLKTV